MNVLYAYADMPKEWNCSEHRCMVPMRSINQYTKNVADAVFIGDLVTEAPTAVMKAKNADVIVYQRNVLFQAMHSLERWRSEGKAVIIDVDDGYHVMPTAIASYNFWINGYVTADDGSQKKFLTTPVEQLTHACKWADAVTSPSRMIMLDWDNSYAHKTHFVNNYLEEMHYKRARVARPTRNDFLVIGWAGSHTHIESFMESGVVTALRRVLEKRNVKLFIGGGNGNLLKRMQLPSSKILTRSWSTYADWPSVLAGFDIGIAPLAGHYDRRRSWLKGAEYSLTGIPWVATNGEPYKMLAEYGTLVQNKASAWEEALLAIIDDYQCYYLDAEKRIAQASDIISVEKNIDKVIAIYQEVLEDSKKRTYDTKFAQIHNSAFVKVEN